MFEPNVQIILDELSPTDRVLDIGGWACPFNRANYVLDAQPWGTRGFYTTFGGPAFQGPGIESFTPETWIQRDICDHEPYPFPDKFFDFVVCSHTLEDLRDPIWVCREMVRIGKRGYIEVPSRIAESCRGWEHPRLAGLSHHRWLIDIDQGASVIRFVHKFHRINSHWRLSLPKRVLEGLDPHQVVQWLFWTDTFTAFEDTSLHGLGEIDAALARYVASVRPYPRWQLWIDRQWGRSSRLRGGLWRRLSGRQRW